jgi:protein TonB
MKHLLTLIFIIFSFSAFAQIDTMERKLPTRFRNDLPKPPKEKIYPAPKPDEEFTMFPGCDSVKNYTERRKCSDSLMLSFIYANICYPDSARENGIEGTVVISFIVEKDGSISNHRIIRNPGGGLGEEALRIVKMFPKFIPTKFYWQDGEVTIIECPFNLPIRFRLE